nr:hypothetical protein [Tanacetum cinerariifolium]
MSSVPVLDCRILVEIPHRSLFILGLNALIRKIPVHLRRRQLSWTQRIGSLTWRRSLMSWVGNALAWWKAYKQAKGGDAWLITTNTETSTEFMQRFLRLAGFLEAAASTEEEQTKNFQWGLRRSTLNHLMYMPFTDVAQVANAARNYEILHERDDDDTERPDKRRGGGDNHHSNNNNYSSNNNRLNFKSIQSSSIHKHDPNITVPSSPGVPLRVTPTRFALRVDADTQESVVELLVSASSVVKLAICRRIARRT